MAFTFGTKAQTLDRLRGHVTTAAVPASVFFSLREWRSSREQLVARIIDELACPLVAVRSSAIAEDAADQSHAGAYYSALSIPGTDAQELAKAIDDVVAALPGLDGDQVLVQPQVTGVTAAGVIMTYDVTDGAPYYVIEYDDESGSTESVTAGDRVHKTVRVFRDVDDSRIESGRITQLVALCRELEAVTGTETLDIEFAQNADGITLLQVRRIATTGQWHPVTARRTARQINFARDFVTHRAAPRAPLAGSRTILGVMPDWNPAEILGARPRRLAISLYRELITSEVWRTSRGFMGYRNPAPEELMVLVSGRPYIDVRNSFNSFLPAATEAGADAIVDAWLDRLADEPLLHDRVEFDVAATCIDLRGEAAALATVADAPASQQQALRDWAAQLTRLTQHALSLGDASSLASATSMIRQLERAQADTQAPATCDPALGIAHAIALLDRCARIGTFPFAVIARHAFIAETMLRTAVSQGALDADRVTELRSAIETITTDFSHALASAQRGDIPLQTFNERFGHLRPGTYDITSPRYDQRPDLLSGTGVATGMHAPEDFALTAHESRALTDLAGGVFDGVDANAIVMHARKAIAGREYAKFVFTRDLSDALEHIANWGALHGLNRDDLSHLDWPTLYSTTVTGWGDHLDRVLLPQADAARREHASTHGLRMGFLLRDATDLIVVPEQRANANYVGRDIVDARLVHLDARSPATVDLTGALVVIESADPGFDWIFTRGLTGLITKYGGANSHMAVRCAELQLPAAIGCGEETYGRLVRADRATLDCEAGTIRVSDAS